MIFTIRPVGVAISRGRPRAACCPGRSNIRRSSRFLIPLPLHLPKHAGPAAADNAVDACLKAFEVAALYRQCVSAARRMPAGNFEDNLQVACAITDFMQGIVTRHPRDFRNAPIQVYTPAELLDVLRQ